VGERVLTLRELNRATLARQLPLERGRLSPTAVMGVPNSAPSGVIVPVIERIEALHGNTRRFFLNAGASTEDVDRLAQALLGGHPTRTASLG
jgi:hypothetical protein